MNQNTKMLLIGSAIGAIVIAGIWGIYSVFQSTTNNTGGTPTPTPTITTTLTPSVTTSVTPSITATPTPTKTATPTPTPTVAQGKDLTISCTGTEIGTYTFALKNVPQDVTYTRKQTPIWCTIVLRQGSKNFMMFDVPYELYEKQGYSSSVAVESTIPNLRRVRSRKVFTMTGDYKFALTYASASSLFSGTACTVAEVGNATTSPCVSATAIFKKTESEMRWTSIYCSIDPKYIEMCDALLKDIQLSHHN